MKRVLVEPEAVSERTVSEFRAQVWLSDKTTTEPEWEYALTATTLEEAEQQITTSEDGTCWVIQTAIGNMPRFPKDRFHCPKIVRRNPPQKVNPSTRPGLAEGLFRANCCHRILASEILPAL